MARKSGARTVRNECDALAQTVVAESHTFAGEVSTQSCPHSLNTFQVFSYQKFWLIVLVLWSTAGVLHSWFRIPTNGMNVATPAFSCVCVLCVANGIEIGCAPDQIVS